jgi:hypothetical protein
MQRFLLLLIVFAVLATSAAQGQGISPLIQELRSNKNGKASGEFAVTNTSLQPIITTLAVKSFSVVGGNMKVRDLDGNIHVRLSEQSAKIPAKSSHIFWFEVTCEPRNPCWFQIDSSSGEARHLSQGVTMRIWLGETLYACPKTAKNCRETIRKEIFHLPN